MFAFTKKTPCSSFKRKQDIFREKNCGFVDSEFVKISHEQVNIQDLQRIMSISDIKVIKQSFMGFYCKSLCQFQNSIKSRCDFFTDS